MLKILPCLYVGKTKKMGNGIFTTEPIKKNTIVEVSPVVVMNAEERKLLDKTQLYNYIFEWGDANDECCMAMGYVPLYNHSFDSNCEYEMEFAKRIIRIRAVKNIEKGEELFINYNGTYNDTRKLWFDVSN